MNYPKGIEVCACTVLHDGDKILVGKSLKGRGWTFAGGHVIPGETLRSAAIRETQEEFGVDVDIQKQLGSYEEILDEEDRHVLVFVFSGTIRPNQKITPDKLEFDETKWVTMDELEKILFKYYTPIIQMLKNG